MAGQTLNINATLLCPHGGSVKIISSNTHVKADGAFMALSSDQFIVSGCPFMVGPSPSPCLTIKWIVADLHTKVSSNTTLSSGSSGLCLNAAQAPQGSVSIINVQPKVKSQ